MAEIKDLNDVRMEMNALVARVSEDSFLTVLRSTLAEFEYQGLDVLGIVREIFRRGNAAGRSRPDIQNDVSTMIILFLSRGNNVEKMLTRTNETGKARITALRTIYNLANSVGRGGNTVVTLSRVAAVFPVGTLTILANETVAVPRAVTLSVNDFGTNFPRQMQTVIAAAVFPRGTQGTQLMKALLLYLIEENKLLSTTSGSTDADILAKVIPFARASFVSSVVPQSNRFQACLALRMLNDQNQLATEIVLPSNIFGQRFPFADLSFMA
nr:nucleocapsid [Phasivirus phasiense]